MTHEEIMEKVRNNEYDYTLHTEIERKADSLTFQLIYCGKGRRTEDRGRIAG